MYILADKFLGNIKNTSHIYFEGNAFHYTNDNTEWKHMNIDKEDIFEGDLISFYTYATIYDWIALEVYEKIKEYKEDDKVYIQIQIDSKNNVKHIFPVKRKDINYRIYEPLETVAPDINNLTVAIDGNYNCIMGNESPTESTPLLYNAHICLPTMHYHKKANQYVFDTLIFFSYRSNLK